MSFYSHSLFVEIHILLFQLLHKHHLLEVRVKHIILLIIIGINSFFNLTSVNWGWHCIIKSTIYTNIVCLRLFSALFLFSHWSVITSFWKTQFIIRSVFNATIFHMMLILPIILTVTGWITSLTLIDQQIWRWRGWDITPITVSCWNYLLLIMMVERRIRMWYQIRS